MAPPVQPSRGLLGFFGLAPANWLNAETAPARSWLSNEPNAPWQSDRMATLIGVPVPVRGATAGCGSGGLLVSACCFSGAADEDVDDDLLLLRCSIRSRR